MIFKCVVILDDFGGARLPDDIVNCKNLSPLKKPYANQDIRCPSHVRTVTLDNFCSVVS